ncbi:MAG: hypothetical protein INR71_00825 [Terriglobus roseus]|nr:hypothetical protein [Terriglobus roseus]
MGARTPRQIYSPMPDPMGQAAVIGVATTPSELYTDNKRRSTSAHQQKGTTQSRKSATRSSSSGTGNAGTASAQGRRPVSTRQRDSSDSRAPTLEKGLSYRSNRESVMRTSTAVSASSVGSPVDVKSLLDGIEVDGYGADSATRRPPY